jgi:hypothetical protein
LKTIFGIYKNSTSQYFPKRLELVFGSRPSLIPFTFHPTKIISCLKRYPHYWSGVLLKEEIGMDKAGKVKS